MNSTPLIRSELLQAKSVLEDFISNSQNLMKIEATAALITQKIRLGGKILTCGNGGSHCDAMHFAEELTGRYRENRKPIAAMALSDPSHISCVGNDYGFDFIFSRMVEALGNENDVLLCISTSGNSANVLNAAKAAQDKGMDVIGLTGGKGGKLSGLSTIEICVPHIGYADRVQEMHIKIIHILILLIEKNFE